MSKGLVLGLVLGLGVGLTAGWIVFGGSDAAPRREAWRPLAAEPGTHERTDWPTREPDEPDVVQEPSFLTAATLRDASFDELRRLAANRDAVLSPDAVGALSDRLDDARAQRDWNTFRALLTLLGRAGTPEADHKLIALMGDRDLGFYRTHMGRQFFNWLKDSQVPGIVEAARTRIEAERARDPNSRSAERGWLALVAQHGSAADLDWLESLGKGRSGKKAVIEALVAAGDRPELVPRVAALFRERKRRWYAAHLNTLAGNNPELAADLFKEALLAPRSNEGRDLARAYGKTVSEKHLEEARGFLLGLPQKQRLSAVYSVERMRLQGLDVSGMEAVTQAPTEELERLAAAPRKNSSKIFQLRYAIQHNKVTWSERAAKALEEAAKNAPKGHAAALRATAQQVRAGIGSPDSEWIAK